MAHVFARSAAIALLFLLAPGLALADARADLVSAYQKMMDGRFESQTVTSDGGKDQRIVARYDTMRRVHMTTPDMEIVMTPEGTWMRAGDEWMQPPFDMGGMMKRFMPTSIDQLQSGLSNVKEEGMQPVDGKSLRAISYDQNMSVMGIDVTSHNKAFLDSSGRIVRAESTGEAMGRKSSTVQTIRYDDSIRVEKP